MARPRTIKLPDGKEISLKGFTPEQADQFEEQMSGVSSVARGPRPLDEPESIGEPEIPTAPVVEDVPTPAPNLTEVAVGLFYNKKEKMFKLVEIGYDPETMACVVSKVKDAGEYKGLAINHFRITCVEKNLVS